MIYLELRKSTRTMPLEKAPFIFRLFLTSVAILAMFAVVSAIETESRIENDACVADVGWDLTTMWH